MQNQISQSVTSLWKRTMDRTTRTTSKAMKLLGKNKSEKAGDIPLSHNDGVPAASASHAARITAFYSTTNDTEVNVSALGCGPGDAVDEKVNTQKSKKSNVENEQRVQIARLRYENISRVEACIAGTMKPYPIEEYVDSAVNKADRVARFGLSLLEHVYPAAKIVENVLNYSKYGFAAIIFRKDLSGLVSAVLELMNAVQRDAGEEVSMKKTIVGLYYFAAYKRLERGTEPRMEQLQHAAGRTGVLFETAPSDIVDEVAKFIIFAQFAYASTVDQSTWQANNHGYKLVVTAPFNSACMPAFSLLVRNDNKLAVLCIRGTNSIHDVFTNGTADEAELLGGFCHRGMLSAARYIFDDLGLRDCLVKLSESGCDIAVCGHSLGAGVAIIGGLLIHLQIPNLKAYAYAPPACLCEMLAEHPWVKSNVLSLVLRDDLVPRASVANVADLARELPGREAMFERSYADDLYAFRSRAASLWAPASRREKIWDRESSQTTSPSKTSSEERPSDTADVATVNFSEDNSVDVSHRENSQDSVPHGSHMYPTMAEPIHDESAFERKLMGPILVAEAESCVVEPQRNPSFKTSLHSILPSWAQWRRLDQPLKTPATEVIDSGPCQDTKPTECWDAKKSLALENLASAIAARLVAQGKLDAAIQIELEDGESIDDVPFVDVQECDAISVRMVPPGRIVHIYELHGTYRAAVVDHTFKPFRKIELYGNVIDDHSLKNILEAVRCIRATQEAPQEPPEWRSMGDPEARFCMVCFGDVTWEYTASSEAQQARVMHHCRSCGSIVCDACSQNRMTLPAYGIINPARVCDPCYWLGFDHSLRSQKRNLNISVTTKD